MADITQVILCPCDRSPVIRAVSDMGPPVSWQMQPEFTWRDNSIGDSDDHPAPCLRRAEILAYEILAWRQRFGTDGRLLCAGSRGRAPGWNSLPRALLPNVGDQGRVLGRFSRAC